MAGEACLPVRQGSKNHMYLSIIIPAYNEERRIGATLSKIYSFLKAKGCDYEVIVVDDGSSDNTASIAAQSELAKEGKLILLKNAKNAGKGFSVRRGILSSRGDFVLFSDADLSTPITEADKLLQYIAEGFDIVIGSRSIADSDVRVHQPWLRERMGKIFNFFVKTFLVRNFNDTQCGFKLFKGDIARQIADLLKIDGFCFDVEMLYIARQKGYKAKEAGVIWEDSRQSKVRVLGSSLSMFCDLFRIRALHR